MVITIINIILIAVSLSLDAFSLAFSYGIKNENKKRMIIVSILVGIFHFFMPLIGNYVGINLFQYIYIKPKIILFFIFLFISLDMLVSFLEDSKNLKKLSVFGMLFFAFSVSFDSFSIGLGLNYIYNNVLLSVLTFSITSFLFTYTGYLLGKKISSSYGRYAFLIGSILLFLYSLKILTNS